MGEGLTLLFPISFDPVKCVDLILQMPLRKLSRGCIRGNAHTSSSKRRRRLKRGLFRSVVDPQAAINRFLAETNAEPKPFTWTADPDKIIAAVRRRAPSARLHPLDSRRAVYLNFE